MSYVVSNRPHPLLLFFFFNDTATTEIYTLSLHDALPISIPTTPARTTISATCARSKAGGKTRSPTIDRKSTRLNSSHSQISYAVFCLKKKKEKEHESGGNNPK